MSDSLTEYYRQMSEARPPSQEYLDWAKEQDRLAEEAREVTKDSVQLFLFALLKDGLGKSLCEMEYYFHDALIDVLTSMERQGLVKRSESYRWTLTKKFQPPKFKEPAKPKRRKG